MSEFSLINRYCKGIGPQHPQTVLGVGDDAALLTIPAGNELAVSVDTMVEGVHFTADTDPADLAHKILAVNVSDMAAMGAVAQWATLALTLPQQDHAWLHAFSTQLKLSAQQFNLQLVGGDTTRGALCLSLQVLGLVKTGCALRRDQAYVGDSVWVTGNLGDAALALHLREKEILNIDAQLNQALDRPQPPVEFAAQLGGLANAAIDISDGLVADLTHIATCSDVSIVVDSALLPLSEAFHAAQYGTVELALYGGDDYQLAFTAPASAARRLRQLADECSVRLSCIGDVIAYDQRRVSLRKQGQYFAPEPKQGFNHF